MRRKLLRYFSRAERLLWGLSVVFIGAFDRENYLTLAASLIGVTSLIFNAKGNPIGQVLMVIFSLLYGIISYTFAYYGEMVTYLGMTMPMAVQPTKTGGRHAAVGLVRRLNPEKAAHQGVTAQVCPSASELSPQTCHEPSVCRRRVRV